MKSISFLLLLLICQPLYGTHADSPDYVFKNISKESVVLRTKTMLDKLKLNYWLIEDFQIKVATSVFSSDYVVNIGHNSKSEPTITINVSNLNLSKKFKDHIIFTLKLADLESITEQESLVSVPVASLLKLKNSLYRLGGVNYEVNMQSEIHKFNITINSVLVNFQIFNLSDKHGFLGLKVNLDSEYDAADLIKEQIIEAAQLCDFDINKDIPWEEALQFLN